MPTMFSLFKVDPYLVGVVVADGLWLFSCFWNGLTVFGRKNYGFTAPLFLNGF